jgi:hypothetical protein
MGADTITSLINLAVKYGPVAVQAFIELFKKGEPTIAEVEAAFAGLRKYEDIGIPDQVPAGSPS